MVNKKNYSKVGFEMGTLVEVRQRKVVSGNIHLLVVGVAEIVSNRSSKP